MSAPADGAVWRDATADDGGVRARVHLAVAPEAKAPAVVRKRHPTRPDGTPRKHTLSMRRQSKKALAAAAALYPDRGRVSPASTTACPTVRPCPYVSCVMHLALDVDPRTGSIRVGFPGPDGEPDLDAMPDTCALDVADRGGATLEEVGAALGITRERARQIEDGALSDLAGGPLVQALADVEHVDSRGEVVTGDDGSGARTDCEAIGTLYSDGRSGDGRLW